MFRVRDKYRVQWTAGGRRHSRTFRDFDEALLFELQIKRGEVRADRAAAVPTFGEFADRWIEDYCKLEKAESQWREDARVIDKFLRPAFGELRLDQLRRSHLAELKATLAKRKTRMKRVMAPKTVNLIIGLGKKMLETAKDWEYLNENPWAAVRALRIPHQEMQYWTPQERDAFVARAYPLDPEFTRLVVVAAMTGLRKGELAALKIGDLSFGRRTIRVSGTYLFREKKRQDTTKSKRVQYVEMNARVRAALQEQIGGLGGLSPEDPVFPLRLFHNSRPRLDGLCREAKVQRIRFHDLRHTFASCLAMAGVDLMIIQRAMRHSSYQMTLRYAHLHPDHFAGVTEVLCEDPAPNCTQKMSESKKWWAYKDLNLEPSGYELAGA